MDASNYDLVESPLLAAPMLAAAQEYWTAERMEEIRPIPLRAVTRPGRSAPSVAPLDDGRTLTALPTPPGVDPRSGVSNADTRTVPDVTVSPFCHVGKLRMTFAGGDYQGSAWVIGKKAILTAGHCVYDGGFATNVQFLPQLRDGTGPAPFSVVRMTTLREFAERDDLRFDIGAGILDRPIDAVTGVGGYVVNANPLTGKLIAVGYPAQPQDGFPFDGRDMWQSVGEVASDPAPGTTQDRTVGMFNDLSGGCSGGPWFTADGPPLAVGLNSHIYTDSAGRPVDVPRQMRSPYFGAAFLRILKWIRDNGGEPNEPGVIGDGGTVPPVGHDHTALKAKLATAVAAIQEVAAGL